MKIILTIIVLGVLLGTGIFYRKQIGQFFTGNKNQVATATPTPTIYPFTATPFATAAPTAQPTVEAVATPLPSIADIQSDVVAPQAPDTTGKGNSPLPHTGPADDALLAVAGTLTSGAGAYYAYLKRRLTKRARRPVVL